MDNYTRKILKMHIIINDYYNIKYQLRMYILTDTEYAIFNRH